MRHPVWMAWTSLRNMGVSWLRRGLVVLAATYALYRMAGNAFLNTALGARALNAKPERFHDLRAAHLEVGQVEVARPEHDVADVDRDLPRIRTSPDRGQSRDRDDVAQRPLQPGNILEFRFHQFRSHASGLRSRVTL